ncbi:MFS transporter [Alicyclobacillus dauci]|uniref:MFS transporter n=1 Tax=Alicyclobacillus dauci TaxID=1475485 RepID=A0ABY6Z2R4_9BACL|nr:MFS transporter [Alicyclobacillus dauci]WAH37189.1 MFS transporter [Alicyclobacillus dauci]
MKPSSYIRMSVYYLLFYTTVAVFAPYFNLYLTTRGLSSSQVGIVLAVMPLVGLVVQPMWGIFTDWFRWRKGTVYVGLIVCPLLVLTFPLLHGFFPYVVVAALIAAFQTGLIPVMDSMTVFNAGARNYGKVRLFGSLGYAITVGIAGRLYHEGNVSTIVPLYVIAAAMALVGLLLYPKADMEAPVTVSGKRTLSPFSGIGKLVQNRRFVWLLVFTLLVSISTQMNSNFFTLYYSGLHRPLGLLGLIYSFGAFSELPFFFISGRWIERYGAERMMLLASSVFLFRWLILAFGPPTWVLFCLQLLHGLSFGISFAAGVAVASQFSEVSNRTTAQTVYSAVNVGLAAMIASALGGVVLQAFGPRTLYACSTVVSAVGVLGMIGLLRVMRKHGQFDNAPSVQAAETRD